MYHVEPSWSQQIGKEHKAYVLMTDKSYGNLSINQEKETLHGRQEGLVGRPWAYLEQVHGNSVIEITRAGEFQGTNCLLYTSPSPRDATLSRMPSSA